MKMLSFAEIILRTVVVGALVFIIVTLWTGDNNLGFTAGMIVGIVVGTRYLG